MYKIIIILLIFLLGLYFVMYYPSYEAFTNKKGSKTPDDFLVKLFYASLGVLGVYLLLSIMKKIKDRK